LKINLLSVAVILASLVDILPEPLDSCPSFLRIPTAGFRGHIDGALGNVGADANLWTRSAKGSKSGSFHMYSGSAQSLSPSQVSRYCLTLIQRTLKPIVRTASLK
jgi:hypothetical protein